MRETRLTIEDLELGKLYTHTSTSYNPQYILESKDPDACTTGKFQRTDIFMVAETSQLTSDGFKVVKIIVGDLIGYIVRHSGHDCFLEAEEP